MKNVGKQDGDQMKLTTQRLKKLIKEELEGLEETSGQMIYVITEKIIDGYNVSGPAYRSREAAEMKAQELNDSNQNPMSDYEIVEVQLMD